MAAMEAQVENLGASRRFEPSASQVFSIVWESKLDPQDEDYADTQRDTPVVAVTGRHSSWPSADMHYQLGSSSFASGSGTSSNSSKRVQNMEEASESWHDRRACLPEFGRGAEYSRPTIHKSSQQVSAKLVIPHPSGSQRSVRSNTDLSLQGQLNSYQGFSSMNDSSGVGNMDTDTRLGMGLSSRLCLSDAPTLTGHRYTGSSPEYSLRRSGLSTSGNSNLYPGRMLGQATGIAEYTHGRGTGQAGDAEVVRSSTPSGFSLLERSTGLAVSGAYQTPRNSVIEEPMGDHSLGGTMTGSLSLDQRGRGGQPILYGSSSSFTALSDPLMASGSSSSSLYPMGEEATCSGSLLPLNSPSLDKSPVREETHGYKDGVSANSACGNNAASSSRASACKRKSCTPSLLVSSSCRSSSPHFSGLREGYGMRSTGGYNTGRRSSTTIGCVSASDVVASASAVVAGRCVETSVAASAVDEQRTRKSCTARDGDSPGSSRAPRASSGGGTTSASIPRGAQGGGAAGHLDHQISKRQQSPFGRAPRRAIPALQPDTWCARSVPLADFTSGADFSVESGSALARSTEQLMTSAGNRRSGSPLVASNRSASTVSSRRHDHPIGSAFGDRLPSRYMSSNASMVSGTSGTLGAFGGIGTESRLRGRNYINNSLDSNSFGSVAPQTQTLANTQGVSHLGNLAGPTPSIVPPYTPTGRTSQNISDLHVSLLSPPSSGLAPSRLPPSPPSSAPSLSSAMEVLPSGSSIFQGSLLQRSSPSLDGHIERGLGSPAETLLGFPFRGLHLADGEHQPRLVAEGLAEILHALDRVERDEDLTYEQLLMLEATLLFGGMGLHDQHSDLRLDVDNMSYEELLALEERIGNVSTGLATEDVNKLLKKGRYSSQAAVIAGSQESDIKCSVCQEEYEEGDELGKIDCGHSYHIACIKQWLVQKNQCPICKASALA